MAVTITNGVSTASTTNATSYASAAFTPAAGDLLVAFVRVSGNVVIPEMTDSIGLGWDYIGTSAFDGTNVNTTHLFVANTPATASSMTATFTCVGTTASGAVVNVLRVAGMTKFGSFAIRQVAFSSNNAAASTTSITFGSAVLSTNPVLGAIGNATNPATMTPPTLWTEFTDTGYATPTIGLETAGDTSGLTLTTVIWGSNSASAWGGIVVELDDSNTGWTIIQSKQVNKTAGTGTTGTVALATTTTGSMLTAIGITDTGAANSITAIAATGTTNWTKKVDITDAGGADEVGWYGYNTTSSATPTLTVTFAASTIGTVFINEYVYYNSGTIVALSSDPFDQLKSATGGPSTTPATGNTPALAASGDLLVAGAGTLDSANRYQAGTGYGGASGHQNGTTLDGGFEDGVATSSSAQSASFTITASDDWGAFIMAFKQPSTGTNGTVTQVGATVTATGGTQAIATIQNISISQSAATVTATGGTQGVVGQQFQTVTQVAANITATGGTQAVASIQDVSITQVHATLTATGGTQSVSTTAFGTVSQVAATITATGGTQLAETNGLITQVAANLTVTGGTQVVASIQDVSISQVGATLTATGGTQVVSAGFVALISQIAATLTATGGTQAVVSKQVVAIAQTHATLTATGGTQAVASIRLVTITQVHATVTATGGTQVPVALSQATIAQVFASIIATGGIQKVFAPPVWVPITYIVTSGSKFTTDTSGLSVANVLSGAKIEDVTSGTKTNQIQSGETEAIVTGSETKVNL